MIQWGPIPQLIQQQWTEVSNAFTEEEMITIVNGHFRLPSLDGH
jgi:hypothetical protein